jgi:microtubule-associated protein, RP/EB family
MDAAYFIGRRELLDFFNDLLQLNLSKIEQTATGAIACQLTELIFPGSIPMSKYVTYFCIHVYRLFMKPFVI